MFVRIPIAVVALLFGTASWSCSGKSNNGRVEQPPIAQANGHYIDAGASYLSSIDGGATPFIGGASDAGAEWEEEPPAEEIPPGELPESDPYGVPEPGDPDQPRQPDDPLDPSSPTPAPDSPDPLDPADPTPTDPISPEPGEPAPPPTGPDLPY
jgi:hypothetical protein